MKSRNKIFTILNIYFAFSLIYYCFGDYKWNIPSYFALVLYVVLCYLCLNIGYRYTLNNAVVIRDEDYLEDDEKKLSLEYEGKVIYLFRLSCIALIVFQIAWVVIYFGQFSFMSALESLGDNYYQRLDTSFDSSVPIMQVRTLFWFVTMFAYPLGFHLFKKLPRFDKWLFVLALIIDVFASLNMGISKNIGDIAIIFLASMTLDSSFENAKEILKKFRKVIIVIVAFLLIFSFVQTARSNVKEIKSNPYGSFATVREVSITDFVSLGNDTISDMVENIGTYVSHAYTGLAYAMTIPFENTYGLGFSRALMEYADQYFGIDVVEHTYTQRIDDIYGWHNGQWWPTAFAWIGNAVSLWLVPIIMLLMGRLFKCFEKSWNHEKSIVGRVLYCNFVIAFIYLPCNAQIVQSRASFISTTVLLFLYAIRHVKITFGSHKIT